MLGVPEHFRRRVFRFAEVGAASSDCRVRERKGTVQQRTLLHLFRQFFDFDSLIRNIARKTLEIKSQMSEKGSNQRNLINFDKFVFSSFTLHVFEFHSGAREQGSVCNQECL